ncbi:MAG TPA: DEAD/DEAH box helicase [Deltaproteobacteria bacterium]|nr:DEAD/DEAH box helicase [Deltaproteobacteria bacterium]
MYFSELALEERILLGIRDAGFTECTPVQEATFVHSLKGRDVCAQSQTGTGKTAAFLISIFHSLSTQKDRKALIIVPTRELAVQVMNEALVLAAHLDISIACIYGGVGYRAQEQQMMKDPDIIVGTPGRLLDFHRSKKLSFKKIGILVIDEADRLFDMGFIPDLKKMLRAMPPAHKRQTMLFSATLSFLVKELAWRYMNNPAEIEIAPEHLTVDTVIQELYHVGNDEKFRLLLGLLAREKPKNCLIFTNMKHTATEISRRLAANGMNCEFITGDLPQNKRQSVIDGLKNGSLPILVATNVAARGLHVDDLDLVVNYDLPEDCEDYVHRIGRTARVGKKGKAISLACERYVTALDAIEKYLGTRIPVIWPENDLFVEDRSFERWHPRSYRKKHRPRNGKALSAAR